VVIFAIAQLSLVFCDVEIVLTVRHVNANNPNQLASWLAAKLIN